MIANEKKKKVCFVAIGEAVVSGFIGKLLFFQLTNSRNINYS